MPDLKFFCVYLLVILSAWASAKGTFYQFNNRDDVCLCNEGPLTATGQEMFALLKTLTSSNWSQTQIIIENIIQNVLNSNPSWRESKEFKQLFGSGSDIEIVIQDFMAKLKFIIDKQFSQRMVSYDQTISNEYKINGEDGEYEDGLIGVEVPEEYNDDLPSSPNDNNLPDDEDVVEPVEYEQVAYDEKSPDDDIRVVNRYDEEEVPGTLEEDQKVSACDVTKGKTDDLGGTSETSKRKFFNLIKSFGRVNVDQRGASRNTNSSFRDMNFVGRDNNPAVETEEEEIEEPVLPPPNRTEGRRTNSINTKWLPTYVNNNRKRVKNYRTIVRY